MSSTERERVIIHKPGGYDRLQVVRDAVPQPGPGEVRVRVRAAGVNFADCVVRMGLYSSAKKYVGWPITPGFEFAGDVEALGEGVLESDLALGTRVLGVTRFGGYASHVVVPRHQLFVTKLDYAEAATFPAVYLTAYYALFVLGGGALGQRVLVHSAAGGVGGALLQLAKKHGIEAVGVVGSKHKVETARELGATHVIDKSSTDLWNAAFEISPQGYDIVFDANGVSTLRQSYEHLGTPGRLVIYGFHSMLGHEGKPSWAKLGVDYVRTPRFNPFEMTEQNKSVLAFNLSYLFERKDLLLDALGKLLAWRDEGALVPLPVTTFPLTNVADAHRSIESGKTTGKLVLIP